MNLYISIEVTFLSRSQFVHTCDFIRRRDRTAMVSHAPPPVPLHHWGKTGGRKEGKNGEMEGWGEKKGCSNDDVGHRGSVERVSEENGRARRRKTGGGEGEKPFATAWPLKSIGGREDWRGSGEKVRKGRERSNPWCGPLGKRGEG